MLVMAVRSDVWKFFSKCTDSASRVKCDLCDKEFTYCGTTSNLRDHLQRRHQDQYKPQQQQQTLITLSQRCSESKSKAIMDLLADVVAMDMRPMTIVEGEGMIRLLKFLEPGFNMPSRKHLTKLLQAKQVSLLKTVLSKEASSMALTSDIWTSNTMEAYLSLTAHFICKKWKMVSCVLQTKAFPERQNIADSIGSIVRSFDIDPTTVVAVVHDSAANAELAGELMVQSNNWASVQCVAHLLQLCINEGLEISTISRAVAAARKLVGHFKHSALATTQLKIRQERMSITPCKLKQDCPTRWNSTLYMIKTLLSNRWPVSAVLSDETVTKRQYRYLDLRNEQWELLEELVKPLQFFETATVYLSADINVSSSCVYPIIDGLVKNLTVNESDSHTIRQFKIAVTASLRRRWSLDDLDITQPPLIVTFFDPRFKGLKFLTESQRKALIEYVIELVDKSRVSNESYVVEDEEIEDIAVPKKKSALDVLLGEEDANPNDNFVEQEVFRYLVHRFPNMSRVTKRNLCIPASSTAVRYYVTVYIYYNYSYYCDVITSNYCVL